MTLPAGAGVEGSPDEGWDGVEGSCVGSDALVVLVRASVGAARGSASGGPASGEDGGSACVGAVVSDERGRSNSIPPPKTRTKPPMSEPSATIATVRGG